VWEGVQALACRGLPKDQSLSFISWAIRCYPRQNNLTQVLRSKDFAKDQAEFAWRKSVTEKWEWTWQNDSRGIGRVQTAYQGGQRCLQKLLVHG